MALAKIIYEVCYQNLRPSFEMEIEPGSEQGPPPLSFQQLCTDMWAADPDRRPDVQGACAGFEKEVKPGLLEVRVSEAWFSAGRCSTISEVSDGGSGLKPRPGGNESAGGSGLKRQQPRESGGGSGLSRRGSGAGSLSSQ